MRANRFISILFVLLLAAGTAVADKKPQKLTDGSTVREMNVSYKFEGPRFDLRIIEIDLNPDGVGELRFLRGTSDEVLDCKIKLLPATIAQIHSLFEAAGFFESNGEYQDKKDFSHMGWVTLSARNGGLEKKTRFNFTTNVPMKTLADIFRGIATQEISLFDIDNAERYQPLDLPKQIEMLENDLRLERIAEPERLVSTLKEIAGDDSQTLIARNHAQKLVEAIKKGKFKSPVKK